MRELWSYGVYPIFIIFVLLFLHFGLYKKYGGVMAPFRRYHRPAALKSLIKSLLLLALVIFVAVQFVRIPLLAYVFKSFTAQKVISGELALLARSTVFTIILMAEIIVLGHLMTYLVLCWIGTARFVSPKLLPLAKDPPPVAVLVPSCDEEPDVLERSLSTVSRLRYPNVRHVLVENSRDEKYKKMAHAVADKYGVEIMDIPNRGHKAGALNDAEALLDKNIKYLAVFDADQSVSPEVIMELVPLLENDDRLAFIQSPQLNEDCDNSLAASAISQQQMLLYDCVLEGMAALRRPPCYGTNCIIRRKAIQQAGGWDERERISQTEDLATSYIIHALGWESLYTRKAYAVGLAPRTLKSYWKQQLRWSTGNSALFFSILRDIFSHKSKTPPMNVAVNYLWSSGFYLNTLAISMLAIWPTMLLIYDVIIRSGSTASIFSTAPSGQSSFELAYLSLYPLYIIVMFFPYLNMRLRGYPLRNMLLVQSLMAVTAPVYMRGIRQALFRSKSMTFTPTRIKEKRSTKKGGQILMAPQSMAFLVFLITGSFIVHRGITGSANYVTWILAFWVFIHTVSLGHYFILSSDTSWE